MRYVLNSGQLQQPVQKVWKATYGPWVALIALIVISLWLADWQLQNIVGGWQ